MTEYLYSVEQIRSIESSVISNHLKGQHFPLMQRAAEAAYRVLRSRFSQGKRLLICCGKGNNAADALLLGQYAKQDGLEVTVVLSTAESELNDNAAYELKKCRNLSIEIARFSKDLYIDANVIVDGLFGIGLVGSLNAENCEFIHWINKHPADKLSIDIPSGLLADTGLALEDCVHATATITFIGYKRGLFTHQGRHFAGEIFLDKLEVAEADFAALPSDTKLMKADETKLQARKADAHKGDFGHVLVIGGDYGMGGAVRVAAEAALRVGAGIVTVATRPEHVCVVSSQRPEIMCHQIRNVEELNPLLEKATVVVIGPGLGMEDWGRSLYERVIQSDVLKVVDADALNILAENPMRRDDWVLTPHPGEAARLLHTFGQAVQKNRFKSVAQLQEQYSGVSVLKGSGTIVAASGCNFQVCPFGNPGMASPGMGDLLSGLIGGLVAQGLELHEAAVKGVLVHARAADVAAKSGGERGLLAMDLLENIRPLVNIEHAVH